MKTGRLVFSATKMIIKFDFSQDDIAHVNIRKLSDLFSEAARSSLLGYHRVVIPRSLAKWAASSLDLSKKYQEHILGLGQEFSQLGGQVEKAKYKILVKHDVGLVNYDNKGTWTIGIDHALPEGFLSQTSLVLENAKNDGEFYKLLFELNAKLLSFGDLSYAPVHGGGNGSAEEIARIAEQKRPVSCICDTDVKAYGGSASATYNSVMGAKRVSNPVGLIIGTPAREVENFLSPDIIRQITENHDSLDHIEDLLNKQENVDSGDCLWLYMDIKDGFLPGVLDAYARSTHTRKWICRKFDTTDEEIKNINIGPLGNNIIQVFMRSNKLKSDFHQHVRSNYWAEHFLTWISEVLWILAGRKRERVS